MQRFPGLIQALCKPSGDHRPQNRSCQAGSRHFLIHLGPATGVVPAFTHPQAAGLTLRRQPLRVPGRHRVEGLARGPVTSAEQHLSMELNVKIDGKPSSFLLACLTMLLMLGVVFWQVIVRIVSLAGSMCHGVSMAGSCLTLGVLSRTALSVHSCSGQEI